MQKRRTLWGALGQPSEKASVTTVSSGSLAINALTYSGCAPALCSCNETRPNSCSRSSRSQDRGQSSAATYTTGRKHRDLDRIQDLTQQRQKTDLSSNVPTCLNSLRHYYVATSLSGSNRLLVRANLPRSQ